jgi:hypothetical protein
MPPQRQPAAKRRTAKRSFLPREEWAQPRGRKFKRSSCGKAFEAQPSSGQTAMYRDPRAARTKGWTCELISVKAKR